MFWRNPAPTPFLLLQPSSQESGTNKSLKYAYNSTSSASAEQPYKVLAEMFSSFSALHIPLTLLPTCPGFQFG